MKRFAFVLAVVAVAACAKKEQAVVDSAAAPAMAPAPAATDSAMKMDSGMKMDTGAAKDSAKKM